MDVVSYKKPLEFSISKTAIPKAQANEVLIKGVCGTDEHIHHGDFGPLVYPLVPGHEVVGVIAEVGRDVTEFAKGDRVVGDPIVQCGKCFFCRRGQFTLCENFGGHGVSLPGGFSEYVTYDARKVYKIHNISDEEAALVEPTACAIHGMDRLGPTVGIEALVLGAGPSGLVIAQLLKLNGASRVVVAANKGTKTQVARSLDAADEYVELDRENPQPQWDTLKADNPYGFDVVVEATGSASVAELAINYVRRGGTLLLYSVYDSKALVSYSPSKIFTDEIKIIGTFAQAHCFARAVAYLDSGKIRVKGLVTDVFKLSEYQKALDKMRSRDAGKIAIKP
ncbi:NADP+-dependent D-mannitol dehydrogenase [Lentinus brumalis]|uniref:NADP+-dependent D-mannitol dehydrogenase n=1 Tax=Lentinus brumalis TaxID=2498619 RepID=A0A371CY28_9APHY|nr:NADP+-dependent D-mannitol dehydrogenase [Polyporus brumalis]